MARTARGRATREAFREGARRVFTRDGYLNARLSDIAAEADRSPALLYQHYDGKEALLAELAEDFSEKLQAKIAEPYRSGLTPIAALREAIRLFWLHYREHLAEVIGISQAAMIDPAFAARWREIHRSATELIARDIRAAQSAGYCPGLHPEIAASALTAMIEQFCLTWQYQNDDPHIELTDETAVETLWQLWGHAVYWTDPLPATSTAR
ncbi:TetR/AcrR family transcriptional regulator [Nocardia spumae]|uniref:TetR/AcrR family transcriptional regulator n=1 Tax=Nocardia spumae TaxID=2887190 RepID=UPI001D148DF8|nr:TetR/AcrR family transcriptional regulator [Nocardia spumae]